MEIKIVIDDKIIHGFKSVFNRRVLLPTVLVVSFLIGIVAIAATIPNAFESGTTISSSAMNENFSYIASRLWDVNENNDVYFTGGKVGIGTATPEYDLDVTGDVGLDGALSVGGNAGVDGALSVGGNVGIDGTMSVTGSSTIGGDLTVSGKLNADGVGGGFTYENTTAVATSIPGSTYEDLDLSPVTGAERSMVFLKVTYTCESTIYGPDITIRSKEDTDIIFKPVNSMSDCYYQTPGFSETKLFWMPTDSTGRLEWNDSWGGTNHSVDVYVVGYIK